MTAVVFGTLPFPNQGGDKIVSKAVSAAIAALFKQTGKIEAMVRAEPVAKLLQGSVDGFDFIGNGMLMYNGLRIEGMELYVQAVSIDFSAIFRGLVNLRQPTQATMRVVLTEDDLTTSFNTPFVVEKLQRLEHEGQALNFQKTEMLVNDDKSLTLRSQVQLGKSTETINIDMTAQVEVEDRRKIQFTHVNYEGDEKAKNLGQALIGHVNSLLDLDKFALDGTQLRVDRIRIRNKELIFYGIAKIDRFPQGKK
ncbi:LmeA family phospholipid-binding protein [Crocosphaera sp. Alani8]|uniref:LmeA family phospholipid-binding protein n=1 Tax=Crocosphaera sp. Alani8 TaxID=3038952 RepID=UPI00313D16D3